MGCGTSRMNYCYRQFFASLRKAFTKNVLDKYCGLADRQTKIFSNVVIVIVIKKFPSKPTFIAARH